MEYLRRLFYVLLFCPAIAFADGRCSSVFKLLLQGKWLTANKVFSWNFDELPYGELTQLADKVSELCPSPECYVLGIGRSPFTIVDLLNLKKTDSAGHLAFSYRKENAFKKVLASDWVKVFENYHSNPKMREKLFKYFDEHIPSAVKNGTQDLAILDYSEYGASIKKFLIEIEAYNEARAFKIKLKGISLATHEDSVGRVRDSELRLKAPIHVIPLSEDYPYSNNIFNSQDLKRFAPYGKNLPHDNQAKFEAKENRVAYEYFRERFLARAKALGWPLTKIDSPASLRREKQNSLVSYDEKSELNYSRIDGDLRVRVFTGPYVSPYASYIAGKHWGQNVKYEIELPLDDPDLQKLFKTKILKIYPEDYREITNMYSRDHGDVYLQFSVPLPDHPNMKALVLKISRNTGNLILSTDGYNLDFLTKALKPKRLKKALYEGILIRPHEGDFNFWSRQEAAKK